jgi:hypothetical protein
MTFEIKRENWADFFTSLSKRRFGWDTRVEILKSSIGDQVMTEGLPFNGTTFESIGDVTSIDISVGESAEAHQTHNIQNPARVAYLSEESGRGEVIDIEEADGTKTLITFMEPMAIVAGYAELDIAVTAA